MVFRIDHLADLFPAVDFFIFDKLQTFLPISLLLFLVLNRRFIALAARVRAVIGANGFQTRCSVILFIVDLLQVTLEINSELLVFAGVGDDVKFVRVLVLLLLCHLDFGSSLNGSLRHLLVLLSPKQVVELIFWRLFCRSLILHRLLLFFRLNILLRLFLNQHLGLIYLLLWFFRLGHDFRLYRIGLLPCCL